VEAAFLGYTATVLFSAMMLPQLWLTWKSRERRGLSLPMLLIGLVANVIAFSYATCIEQRPLQVKYVFAFCCLAACTGAYFRCKRSTP
jgi:uncharacterized protein with PQ loop repeat